MRQRLGFIAFLLLFALPASAQSVVNPSAVTFTVSTDHADITSYTLGYFAPGATLPLQEVDLGKPTPVALVATVPINVKPLGWVTGYTVKVKAVASATVMSEWSEPSNFFDRKPGKPGGPVVK